MTKAIILATALVLFVGSAIATLLPTSSDTECGPRTPHTFIVSVDPYRCDLTRGGGPLVP